MGRGDKRHSPKMRRRKGQRKLKARQKRKRKAASATRATRPSGKSKG
jgi:hypothetical protein